VSKLTKAEMLEVRSLKWLLTASTCQMTGGNLKPAKPTFLFSPLKLTTRCKKLMIK